MADTDETVLEIKNKEMQTEVEVESQPTRKSMNGSCRWSPVKSRLSLSPQEKHDRFTYRIYLNNNYGYY